MADAKASDNVTLLGFFFDQEKCNDRYTKEKAPYAPSCGSHHSARSAGDAVLGLFSFAKFMMYRDLDPALWGELGGLEASKMLRGVVVDGFPGSVLSADDGNIDALIPPAQMMHVVDSDSSQSLVVHDVRQGTSILVQGPPGTGKSQTIANIIAAAVADQKKVLFVAEKMAALEVVKRRLDKAQIGVACLELHSNKANKRILLEELRQTWQLGSPTGDDGNQTIVALTDQRDVLNAHAERLHKLYLPSKLTPYQVFGQLVRLRRLGYTTQLIDLQSPTSWTPQDKEQRDKSVQDLVERIGEMGLPASHAWSGVGNDTLLPNDRDRLITTVSELSTALAVWMRTAAEISAELELSPPQYFADMAAAVSRATALVAAPSLDASAFLSSEWQGAGQPEGLIDAVEQVQIRERQAREFAAADALTENWEKTESALADLLPTFTVGNELNQIATAHAQLERAQVDLTRLAAMLQEKGPLTLELALKLVAIADRATTVPDIDKDALVAQIWERGVDSVEDLVVTVERAQAAKASLAAVFREAAWSKGLEDARLQLASRGGSWLKVFSGQWRVSNRQVRALLVNPKLKWDEVIAALDELINAQADRRKITESTGQGGEAFGASWKGEGSSVTFLRGVVAWMRNLRPLGTGVRERLADLSDRVLASELAKRIRPLLEDAQKALTPVHDALVTANRNPWGEEILLRRLPLEDIKRHSGPWADAYAKAGLMIEAGALSVQELTERIEQLKALQTAVAGLSAVDSAGRSAFGLFWEGRSSDLEKLKAAVRWMTEHSELHALAARTTDATGVLERCQCSIADGDSVASRLEALFRSLRFEGNGKVVADSGQSELEALSDLLDRWETEPEGLPQWVAYTARANEARSQGVGALVDAMGTGDIPAAQAKGAFELAYYEAVLAKMVEGDRQIASFDGQQQTQRVADFSELDLRRMNVAKRQVLQVHHAQVPARGGATGPTAMLAGEMAKKRAHMPIRQLMQKCGPTIQALKPVFMMSPLSVAQFLPPGSVDFDMLVIDEASQVQPVDALGCIARAKQLVIVGDERQLPPTRFFSRTLGDGGDDDDEDEVKASDIESILGLCRARGLPERMLRWHYRSRHQSLIAVSNSQFYENKLFIIPSPFTSEAGVGLRFHHLPEAIYDRGNTRTNPIEAKAVAQAVIAHAQTTPALTLGVATFSTQQRGAIVDELELLRRQHPETEGFFSGHSTEPFFVKSLENIQGDERDVIFIAVGYGRDGHGHMTMNFGPLGKEGGERRLNVLISRAKSRCEVFSSITDEDIDLERTKGKGTIAFKLFLHYARTGRLNALETAKPPEASVFEQEVAAALLAKGYQLHTDVGIAGFFVDIAVSDLERPGEYILGIECDGASYADARSARDRDRLRESALRDKGWQVYRIWSSDWFHRPRAELDKLIAAIEAAKAERGASTGQATLRRAVPVDIETVDRGSFVEVGLVGADEVPNSDQYEEANFWVPSNEFELHQVPSGRMATIVKDIVQIEGPIHRAEVVARMRSLWGLQRAGGRIQAAVEAGIALALAQKLVLSTDKDFLITPGATIKVRDRTDVVSVTLRKPEYLPPQEIDNGILTLVGDNLGATNDEIVLRVCRQFGYRSTSAQLRSLIFDRTALLVIEGKLRSKNGLLVIAS